jgi:hypothetical protein
MPFFTVAPVVATISFIALAFPLAISLVRTSALIAIAVVVALPLTVVLKAIAIRSA